jgi:hypothetical protein
VAVGSSRRASGFKVGWLDSGLFLVVGVRAMNREGARCGVPASGLRGAAEEEEEERWWDTRLPLQKVYNFFHVRLLKCKKKYRAKIYIFFQFFKYLKRKTNRTYKVVEFDWSTIL